MKIAVLTTETSHHAFFVRRINEHFDVVTVCETYASHPPYETHHPFERERDSFEWSHWFCGKKVPMSGVAETHYVETVNADTAVDLLRRERADAAVVFGTGRIGRPVIELYRNRIFNLHGGDPEEYRGLDTHLWAIFHRDFKALVTTLHHLELKLDTGDIIAQAPIMIEPGLKLEALRAANTELCVQIVLSTLNSLESSGNVGSRKQQRLGRYYSAMPATLKGVCKERFDRYTSRRKDEA